MNAATGSVVGAVRTESTEAIQVKTTAQQDELVATSYEALLAQRLQERLVDDDPLDGTAADPASGDPVSGSGDRLWNTFALRLVTRLTLRRDSAAAAWQTAKEVQSDTELTTAQWIASDSKALRGVLDRCIRRVAHQLASDLGRAALGQGAPVPSKYSTSCQDIPAEWQEATRQP